MHLVQKEDLITTITIPQYIREVKTSNRVSPKYWEWNGITIKCKSKKLLQKFIRPECKREIIMNNGNVEPKHLREGYYIIGFKGNYIYCELDSNNKNINIRLTPASQLSKITKYYLCKKIEDGIQTYSYIYEKVVANETKVGKPNKVIINGQNIYNHTASPFTIGKIFDAIKEMYYNKFKTIDSNKLLKLRASLSCSYPVMIMMEIRDTVKNRYDNTKKGNGKRWDVGNRTDPYMKTFLDFLTKGYKDINGNILLKPIIEDDDRLHVTTGNNSFFTPIELEQDRALIFYIFKDTRTCWKPYLQIEDALWQEYVEYCENDKNSLGLSTIPNRMDFYEWKTLIKE